MKKGFTLIELIIVIVIVGILALVALPRYFANIENARKAEAQTTMRSIREAELLYFSRYHMYTNPTWPFEVAADSDSATNEPDIVVAPNAQHFTYTVVSPGDRDAAYIQAARVAASGSEANTYCQCIKDGHTTRFQANSCTSTPCG